MSSPPVIHKTWGEFTPDEVFEMAVLRSEVFFLEQKIDEEEFDRQTAIPPLSTSGLPMTREWLLTSGLCTILTRQRATTVSRIASVEWWCVRAPAVEV